MQPLSTPNFFFGELCHSNLYRFESSHGVYLADTDDDESAGLPATDKGEDGNDTTHGPVKTAEDDRPRDSDQEAQA